MQKKEVEQEYNKIVEDAQATGEISKETGLRKSPRMRVRGADLWISTQQEFSMVDMSLSGMAFLTNHPLEPGERITISLGTALSVHAIVVNCQLDESATEFLDSQFRVQCKFGEEYEGMELLVETRRSDA